MAMLSINKRLSKKHAAFTVQWHIFGFETVRILKPTQSSYPNGNYKRTLARAMCLVNLRIIIFIYGPFVEARKSLYVLLVRKSGTGELPPFANSGEGGSKKHTCEKCAEFIMTSHPYLFSSDVTAVILFFRFVSPILGY